MNGYHNPFTRLIFSSGCHRLPGRSFFFRGKQLPLCARCTGAVLGQYLTLAALTALHFLENPLPVIDRNIIPFAAACAGLTVPMAADWSAQNYLRIMSTNLRRFVTGLLCGCGMGIPYYYIMAKLFSLFFGA